MQTNAQLIWERSLRAIQRDMTDLSFNSWVKNLKPIGIKNNALILEADNDFNRNTLNNFYRASFEKTINEINGTEYHIVFIAPGERKNYITEEEGSSAERLSLNPRYQFDTFVIGSSNNFAFAASLAVAENPAKAYNPLFIYGGVGLGKTHLMHAIGHHILQKLPSLKIMYITSETFTNELIEAIRTNKNAQFRARYRNVDVLMIDDIQFIAGKEFAQEEFFHTFNSLHGASKQIVISSDKQPREIPTLEERLRTRFEWGLIVDIQSPDLETRIAILRNKAMIENLDIDPEVLQFIAEKVKSNIRELEGVLTRVIAFSKIQKQPINLDLAQIALKDILPSTARRTITVDLIQEMVSDYYSITVSDLCSNRRDRRVSFPRQIAMYLCRTLTEATFDDIGLSFGGKDHSTVIHAVDKIFSSVSGTPSLETTINDIITRIKE
ncbi:MAG: chromosomal replication initiator protein DnaA [Bacillota bacterium]